MTDFAPIVDEPLVRAEISFHNLIWTPINLWLMPDGQFQWFCNGDKNQPLQLPGGYQTRFHGLTQAVIDLRFPTQSGWSCRIVDSRVSWVKALANV